MGKGPSRGKVHKANNELIAFVKQKADELGISVVVACGALTNEGLGRLVVGVDTNCEDLELHLSALAHGACIEREELRRERRSQDAVTLGMTVQRSLFDRSGVFDVEDEPLPDDETIDAREGGGGE
jgi:hypothetical protein